MRASPPSRTVFFGSGSFAVPVLEALSSLRALDIVAVVSAPDRPVGRHAVPTPTPVAARAEALGLPILRLASVRTPEAIERIAGLEPELGVLADFGRIIPAALLAVPPRGILNVHPSLLPRHRGATPIPATILAGDEEAGVCVLLMDEGLDTGPILARDSWPLRGDETAPELEARAAAVGAALVARVVPAWLLHALAPAPQPPSGATMTRPFRREDGRLDPAQPAVALERMVRALQPWPGTFLETAVGRLTVLEAQVVAGEPGDELGRLVADADGLALVTGDGRLRLVRVQPAGGRPMGVAEYRRGTGRALAGTRVTDRSARTSGA